MSGQRCAWVNDDPLYIAYHDEEWGVPTRGDRELFEMLCLEGAQAGLSWYTILKKREGYRRAFADFDVDTLAGFSDQQLEALRQDTGIVRNRLKIQSVRTNARAVQKLVSETGTFTDYLWDFVEGKSIVNRWSSMADVPTTTEQSDRMSKALKRRGFKFVGSTICYAFMQATGMVNDHVAACFRAP